MKDEHKIKLAIHTLLKIQLEAQRIGKYAHEKAQIISLCDVTIKELKK